MLWEPSSCCCFSVRTGSLILAALSLGGALLSVVSLSVEFAKNDLHALIEEACTEDPDPDFPLDECIKFTTPVVIGVLSVDFVLQALQVIFSALIIHGIRRSKTRLMVPYMIFLLVFIVILMLIGMAMIGLFAFMQVWIFVFPVGIVFGLIVFLYVYFLLVIRAHYLEIKRTKGRVHMALTTEPDHKYGD